MAITKRLVKGSALTHTELDSNFTDLDGRVTTLESASDSDSQTLTLAGDDLTITGGNTVSLSTLSTEVVDDTTPQLGGNLDLNGKEITGSGGSAITEILDVLVLAGGNNGIIMRTQTGAGKIVIGDQAGDVVLGNSANSIEFVNDVNVDFTNTNVDFTSATVTGLTVSQSIDSLTDVDTSTTPPGVGQVLKWDGAQWEPANDSSGSSGITLTALSVTQASAGTAGLVYNNVTGVFTYTPPDLSTYLTSVPAQTFASLTDINNANGPTTITIGKNAGTTNQGASSIALGGRAGETNQGINGIAIGQNAGKSDQGDRAIAIGRNAATTNQGNQSIVINATGGAVENITADSLVIKPIRNASGTHSMEYNPTTGEVTYDTLAGGGSVSWATLADKNNASGPTKIALGLDAGSVTQGNDAVAIGKNAGGTNQGTKAVAIGLGAGLTSQGAYGIALGENAGETNQGLNSVAIGTGAGTTNQGGAAIAIGNGTAVTNQGESAIAIGNVTVLSGQGDNAIAIGNRAGGFANPQAATSIILNATGAQLENTTASSLVIKPIRNASGTHSMEYNPTTGEVTYDTLASGGLPSRSPPIGATSSLADAAQADLDITGFKSYTLMAITTDKAARVRLYVNAATRTADAARAEGIDPTSDAGVIAEVITTGAETVIISPGAIGFNLESTPTTNIPCRVTNKSGSTGTVQVGLTILQLEA